MLGSAAQVSAQACLPDCRSGYTCIQGACVSACNPPCAADEVCTAQASCELRYQEPPRDPLALAQSTFFVQTLAGVGAWASDRGDYPTTYTDETPPGENVIAVAPVLGAGIGLRHAANRVIGFRSALMFMGGSNFGGESGYALTLDGRFRVGPVGSRFPWFIGVGPVVGLAGFRGRYPNYPGRHAVDSMLSVGGVVDTGLAFGDDYDIEVGLESRLLMFPYDNRAVTLVTGVGVTIGL